MTRVEKKQRRKETTKFVATCALWSGFILAPVPVTVAVGVAGVTLLFSSMVTK